MFHIFTKAGMNDFWYFDELIHGMIKSLFLLLGYLPGYHGFDGRKLCSYSEDCPLFILYSWTKALNLLLFFFVTQPSSSSRAWVVVLFYALMQATTAFHCTDSRQLLCAVVIYYISIFQYRLCNVPILNCRPWNILIFLLGLFINILTWSFQFMWSFKWSPRWGQVCTFSRSAPHWEIVLDTESVDCLIWPWI